MPLEKIVEQLKKLTKNDKSKLLELLQSEVNEELFYNAAGAWNDADEEALIRDIYKRRVLSSKAMWPGTSLLVLAGSFEGPEDLSERHGH